MIKVYEHGMHWKRIRCPECNCDFGFSVISDTNTIPGMRTTDKYVECPECKNPIYIETKSVLSL